MLGSLPFKKLLLALQALFTLYIRSRLWTRPLFGESLRQPLKRNLWHQHQPQLPQLLQPKLLTHTVLLSLWPDMAMAT